MAQSAEPAELVTLADIRAALAACTAKGIMIEQNDCFLALAVPVPQLSLPTLARNG
jgi:hypothetical protein